MTDYTCSIEGCATPAHSRTWCQKHYAKWSKYGDPLAGASHYSSPEESFAARTSRRGDCLEWTGAIGSGGYGNIRVDGVNTLAHRYAWERVNGPIPEGMFLDHICYNRACVKVDHLQVATHAENVRRRKGASRQSRTGVRNVYPASTGFSVKVRSGGKTHSFGIYKTIEEAERVAASARVEMFVKFVGGGR